MKRSGRNTDDDNYLKSVGIRIAELIEEQGYSSPYDFWLKSEEQFSRQTLNNILRGKMDSKLTTIRAISHLLGVDISDLLSER